MEIRNIGGRPHTDIAGAAELTGRSEQTVRLKTSPKQRAQGSGWPAPVKQDKKAWFPIDELERIRDVLLPQIVETARARVHHVDLDGDPEELISASEFRKILTITQGGWDKYVDLSKSAWGRGEDGYLPVPDCQEPAPVQGVTRYWKRRRVQEWINARTGKVHIGQQPDEPNAAP
ncbi:hypothetical protein [Micromonospora chalcea]|uniref:hypothetical protein n=1 Tax=Micromonospora chalcea TaxID=1874 RepID=UPI0016572AAD|nr:hypothetical protein [Micromonospora chalcea]MBC8991771.1 hypothetical protein [Micromonospora chalcea]MCT2282213.1 hypothetical protein [Micromonospora chalcea]